MRHRHATSLVLAAACAAAPAFGAAPPAASPPSQGGGLQVGDDPEAPALDVEERRRLASLDELLTTLELGLQARTIELGEPLVAPGGLLADDGRAVATVARALFQAGREQDAEALLAGARPNAATADWIPLERAWIALQRDELDAARALLAAPAGGASPLRYPDRPSAWLMLARVQARSGRLDQAAAFAARFIELDPLHPEVASAWHLLAREAAQRGDGAAAAEFLERSAQMRQWHDVMRVRRLQVRQAPTAPLPRLGLALGWMQVDEWARAERELEDLLAVAPDYCRARFHLGEARRLGGRPDAAIEAYGEAIECDADDMRPRLNRALLLRDAGRTAEALDDLAIVVAAATADDPLFLGAHLEYARLLRDAGRDADAASAYDRYRALGGDEPL